VTGANGKAVSNMSESGRGIANAAGLLAASVLVARLLGFVRDALFATHVGIGAAADAYFAAFMIPDMLGYLMAAGAAAIAVTPPYIRRLENEGPEAAAHFASSVVGSVAMFSIASTVLLWFYAEPLIRFQFNQFDESTIVETTRLMRIVLPAQIFFLTGGILRGVLMAHGRFAPQAGAAVIYSAAPIVGGLLIAGAEGFAWGTLVGAAIGQWAIPVLALRRLPGAVGRIRVAPFGAEFREYIWLALPLMLGLGLTTVDEWYEKWIGGQLAEGAIAAITYARKIMMAPVGVVGQAVGAALLPSLAALFQREDRAGFDGLLTTTLRATLGLGVLAAGALVVLGLPVVQLLYQHGRFTAANSSEVAGLLVILACAIPGWVLQQVAVRGFYARGEMWRAMTLSTVTALAVFPLYLWGGLNSGVPGLAMASAAAITFNATVTIIWLRARCGTPNLTTLAETLGRTLVITLVAGSATAMLREGLDGLVDSPLISLLLGGGLYGLAVVFGVRWAGDEPMRQGLDRLLAKLRRRPSPPARS
jgi:putative peptidoglycan lipid II flippase